MPPSVVDNNLTCCALASSNSLHSYLTTPRSHLSDFVGTNKLEICLHLEDIQTSCQIMVKAEIARGSVENKC
ncbi:unnamed protein product [Urochloa humidicola]